MIVSALVSSIFAVSLSIGLRWIVRYLSILLKFVDFVTANIFYLFSIWLGLRPSGVYERKKSALVLIGGKADIQTHTALQLSKLGYTVFVLCCQAAQDSSQPTSPTANLVYEWHKRKESSWGMVAPIIVNTRLITDRHRAAETVHAFCENSSLHLTALLFLPDAYDRETNEGGSNALKTPLDSSKAQASMWADTAAHALKDSILFVQDYLEMLAEAGGRVISVTSSIGSYNSPYERATLMAHDYLKEQLEPLGVRTILITADTLCNDPVERFDGIWASRSGTVLQHIHRIRGAITQLSMQDISAVTQEEIGVATHRILCARYPMSCYSIGIYSLLLGTRDNMKDLVSLCVKALIQ